MLALLFGVDVTLLVEGLTPDYPVSLGPQKESRSLESVF